MTTAARVLIGLTAAALLLLSAALHQAVIADCGCDCDE